MTIHAFQQKYEEDCIKLRYRNNFVLLLLCANIFDKTTLYVIYSANSLLTYVYSATL